MEYRIERKEAFRIVGVSIPLHKEQEKNFQVVPEMWKKAAMDGTIIKLVGIMDGQITGLMGVSVCNEEENWKYLIAVASNQATDHIFEEYVVPAATWAVFSGSGTGQSIQELEKQIVTEWLPTSGYEYANAPDIEVYFDPDPQQTTYEVWIPVIKK